MQEQKQVIRSWTTPQDLITKDSFVAKNCTTWNKFATKHKNNRIWPRKFLFLKERIVSYWQKEAEHSFDALSTCSVKWPIIPRYTVQIQAMRNT